MTENESIEQEAKKDESNDELTFESAISKLETHVRTLEAGELSLDQSLAIFEDGMRLAKFCSKKLNEAEGKIEKLTRSKGGKLIAGEMDLEKEK